MDKLKRMLRNPYNWLWILGGISVIFGILFRIFGLHWMYIAAIIPWGPIALFIVVGILFAFIINPIRGFIVWLKIKRDNDDN